MRDVSKFLENGKENLNELLSPFLLNLSTITLVIYTAEKKEHIIPNSLILDAPFVIDQGGDVGEAAPQLKCPPD